MTDKEALFVVVAVDEPTGDTVCSVAANFASVRVEYVDAMNSDLCFVVGGL